MTGVLEVLETAPALIAAKGVELVQKRKQLDTAKQDLEVARAAATIQHQDAKNQKLLEAYVTSDPDVQKMEVALIEAQAAYELTRIDHEELQDKFVSARKLASLDDQELQAIRGSTIRQRPPRVDHADMDRDHRAERP